MEELSIASVWCWKIACSKSTNLFLRPIGMPTDKQRDDAGECPRWGAQQESWDVAQAERSSQSREESVEGQADDVSREGEHHDIDFGILETHDHTIKGTLVLGVDISLSYIFNHTKLSNLQLLFCESSGVGWQVGQDQGCGDAE